MYAQLLRRWSLQTSQMSLVEWLFAVTLLLLITGIPSSTLALMHSPTDVSTNFSEPPTLVAPMRTVLNINQHTEHSSETTLKKTLAYDEQIERGFIESQGRDDQIILTEERHIVSDIRPKSFLKTSTKSESRSGKYSFRRDFHGYSLSVTESPSPAHNLPYTKLLRTSKDLNVMNLDRTRIVGVGDNEPSYQPFRTDPSRQQSKRESNVYLMQASRTQRYNSGRQTQFVDHITAPIQTQRYYTPISKLNASQSEKEREMEANVTNTFSKHLVTPSIPSSTVAPFRYLIESYEVPASRPRKDDFTGHQSEMFFYQHQLKHMRFLQQQTARKRREPLKGKGESPPRPFYRKQFQKFQKRYRIQSRSRKHSRRYCSARDPAQLAFEAPTVFEGKIVSMTPDRRTNFSATIEVREVFKQQIGYHLQKYLRLQFAYRNSSGECDIYREKLRQRGLVRGDELEPGRIYMLFVQQIDIGNFTILGQPIRRTRRVVEAVKDAVSENYAQLASIKSIMASNRTVENGMQLRIVCKVHGRPPPKVTWFKDHKSINRKRSLYQFIHYKKRSELVIRSFNSSDAGRYECRAKNKVNRNIERRAIVIKAYPVPRYDIPFTGGTGNSCPEDASEFCFNGGTCKFFSEIGSYSCICPEGFIGERCDRKEVNNMPPSTYSNEQECGEKKFLGSYYC